MPRGAHVPPALVARTYVPQCGRAHCPLTPPMGTEAVRMPRARGRLPIPNRCAMRLAQQPAPARALECTRCSHAARCAHRPVCARGEGGADSYPLPLRGAMPALCLCGVRFLPSASAGVSMRCPLRGAMPCARRRPRTRRRPRRVWDHGIERWAQLGVAL